jgi:hypothetical protein
MVTVLPALAGAAEVESGELIARPILSSKIEVPTISLITRLGRQLPAAPAHLLSRLETQMRSWDQEAHNMLSSLRKAGESASGPAAAPIL